MSNHVGYSGIWEAWDMEIRGRVSGGVIVLDDSNALPDGTVVRVEPVEDARKVRSSGGPDLRAEKRQPGPSLAEKLCRLAGKAKGLPPDLARNHDHYLHGLPKK